jgi:hypothetical protein
MYSETLTKFTAMQEELSSHSRHILLVAKQNSDESIDYYEGHLDLFEHAK